jgi:uncharacterized SAM-binding protein YcdF (DUF218 family)
LLPKCYKAISFSLLSARASRCLPSVAKSVMILWMMRRKWFLKFAAAFFALLLFLSAALYFFPQTFLCVDSGPAKADVIIVLGGGVTHERPQRAAELFLQHTAPRIVVSGAGDDIINRHLMILAGVPPADIQLESKSKTTRENALFSYQLMRTQNVHSAIIVTSWYHSRRALNTFEHFAPGIKFYSRPSYFNFSRSSHWDKEFFRHVYFEYAKLPEYLLRYGVWPF